MRNLNIALRSLFKKERHNMTKILSLGIGLAVALVLIAKICFERSFDSFYPDVERVYRLVEYGSMNGGDPFEFSQTPGAVAPAMKEEVPGIEAATRLTYVTGKGTRITAGDKRRYLADNVLMADSCLFDVLPRPVLSGDPKKVLARPGYAMISRSLAERLGGIDRVEGEVLVPVDDPGSRWIVGGVFEDVPENSHLRYDILVSLEGMAEWSRNNWVGNDRYLGYVRLAPGVTPEGLDPAIRRMIDKHIDSEEMRKAGASLLFSMKPLREMHAGTSDVRNMFVMLTILASALLFTAMMNYILIALSSLAGRSKEIALHKSYGASGSDVLRLTMTETLLHMAVSMVLAIVLIFLCRGLIEDLLGVSPETLLLSEGAVVLLGVCAAVFLVTGLVPGILFARIPVTSAFRRSRESRRIWKLSLLFLQFAAAGLLVSLLIAIGRQHRFMLDSDPGYSFDRLAFRTGFGDPRPDRRRDREAARGGAGLFLQLSAVAWHGGEQHHAAGFGLGVFQRGRPIRGRRRIPRSDGNTSRRRTLFYRGRIGLDGNHGQPVVRRTDEGFRGLDGRPGRQDDFHYGA